MLLAALRSPFWPAKLTATRRAAAAASGGKPTAQQAAAAAALDAADPDAWTRAAPARAGWSASLAASLERVESVRTRVDDMLF